MCPIRQEYQGQQELELEQYVTARAQHCRLLPAWERMGDVVQCWLLCGGMLKLYHASRSGTHSMYAWLWHLRTNCWVIAKLVFWHAPSHFLLTLSSSPGVDRHSWPPFFPEGGNLMHRFPANVTVSCCTGLPFLVTVVIVWAFRLESPSALVIIGLWSAVWCLYSHGMWGRWCLFLFLFVVAGNVSRTRSDSLAYDSVEGAET